MKDSTNSGQNTLTKKLTKRVLHYYFTLYLCLFILLIAILVPILYRSTLSKNLEYTELISSEYEQLASRLDGSNQLLIGSTKLQELLGKNLTSFSEVNSAKIEQILQSYVASDSKIQLIQIEDSTGRFYNSLNHSSSTISNMLQLDDKYQDWKNGASLSYYSSIFPPEIWEVNQCYTLAFSNKNTLSNRMYYFTIYYNVDSTLHTNNTICNKNFSDYLILNRKNELIYATAPSSSPQIEKVTSQKGYFHDSSGIYSYVKAANTSWLTIAHTSWIKFFSNMFLILGIVLSFYIITPLFYYFLVIPIINKNLEPLARLTHSIKGYRVGQPLVTKIHTGDELEVLSETIDNMVIKIDQQVEEIQNQEHQNFVTRYRLLATQVDPHFIYNTLNIINIMAKNNAQHDILAVNTALGKILKERFSTKTSIFESLESALDTLTQYCTIMQHRYKNRVVINVEIEPALLNERIPKNLLLPLFENSFYHGLAQEDGVFRGKINIIIYSIENEINIEISDDGKGIPLEKLLFLKENNYQTPDKDRTHIGLSNVHERLSYIYKDRYKMNMNSSVGFGTTCSISLPFYESKMDFDNDKTSTL